MSIQAIDNSIALARAHEEQTGHLAKLIGGYLNDKPPLAIQLPEQNPVTCLLDFIITYIEQVPRFLEAARAITEQAELSEHTDRFFEVAESFFIKPPEIMAKHIGLEQLMDEAYLAHRLLEEINDQFLSHAGIPLIPLDTTAANLIIHNLIGEPFANELDEAVDFTVQQTMPKRHVYKNPAFKAYIAKHQGNNWREELSCWPCLTETHAIDLDLNFSFSR